MEEQLRQKYIGDILAFGQTNVYQVPAACRNSSMTEDDNRCIHNENMNWLSERDDRIPIWSRLKSTNCLGQNRNLDSTKQNHCDIEIPNRLFSLFGTPSQHINVQNKMKGMQKYQLLSCCLALCAALKYNLDDWTSKVLDAIYTCAADLYDENLKKLNLTNEEFNLKYINNLYQFDNTYFRVQSHQVCSGFLYIRYGLNEFNLARALTWFFRLYQFGIINCYNRTIAFGCNVDEENSFFMYDCQGTGNPLFEDNQTNSYVLRTNHLQVLLYCLIIIFNVALDRIKFYIYNVDVRIEDPREMKKIKKQVYVPTITYTTEKFVEKKIDNKIDNPTEVNELIPTEDDVNQTCAKSTAEDSVTGEHISKSNNEKSLIATDIEKTLPTASNIKSNTEGNKSTTKDENSLVSTKQSSFVKTKTQYSNPPSQQQQSANKSTSPAERFRNRSPSVPPKPKAKNRAADAKVEPEISSNLNPLGLKVYLVDNSNNCNSFISKKVKVVNQLKDLHYSLAKFSKK